VGLLDRLFGDDERVADLEAELATLREERSDLQARLDAESERRAEAVSERQAAQERVNRLEDRVAQLEGELDRVEDETVEVRLRGTEDLRGGRTREVLARLASVETEPEGALTAAVDDAVPETVREAVGDRAGLVEREAPCVVVTDDAGLVSATLDPPVQPDPFVRWGEGFDLDPGWFLPEGEYALALVRADLFALGDYDGDQRLSADGFTTDVMGRHSKGGFSQSRFERLREEQRREHVRRCRERLRERAPDRLVLVGDRAAVDALAETDLPDTDLVATGTVDATGDPEEALDGAFRAFWTTRLALL
jgi:peptide subunit release factor 1 (eRF1)